MKDVLLSAIKKYRWKIFIEILFISFNTYLLTYPAKIVGNIVDLLYDVEQNGSQIMNNTYYLLGICVILLLIRLIWKHYVQDITRGMEVEIKNKLFERMLKVKLEKLQEIKNGELMSYFVRDANEIRKLVNRILQFATRLVSTFTIVTITMATSINLSLTIAAMIPIIISILMIIKLQKYVSSTYKKCQEKFTDFSEYIQESTDSIRTTKAYSCEENQLKEFARKNKELKKTNNIHDIYYNSLKTSINICFGLCYGISLIYGSQLVLENAITVRRISGI